MCLSESSLKKNPKIGVVLKTSIYLSFIFYPTLKGNTMKAAWIILASSLLSPLAAEQKQTTVPKGCCPRTNMSNTSQPACCPKPNKWCDMSYEFYGAWLFLQPNGSNLYYAAEAIPFDPDIAVPAVSPNWEIKEIDPNYHSGFEIGTIFLFRNTNIDIKLNWERLHAKDTDSVKVASSNMVGPLFDIGPNSTGYGQAKGKLRSHFDAVNLNVGKKICFFNRLYMDFDAGVGFVRIKQNLKSNYSNTTGTIARSVATNSQFIGAGPQLGIYYDYRIVDNLFFTGNTDLSLLMGQMKNHTRYKSFSPDLTALGIPQPNTQKTSVPNRAQLVPGFEQKLGFSYVAVWKRATIALEIGYQCQIYIDAIQSIDMTAPQVLPTLLTVSPTAGVYAVGFERTLSNYILTGPYASLGVAF